MRQGGQDADVEAGDGSGLKGSTRRGEQPEVVLAGQKGDREDSAGRVDSPIERQFTGKKQAGILAAPEQAAGRQDANGDRKVEPRASLPYAGWSQIDGDSVRRKGEAGVLYRTSDPVATFADARVWETDHRERRKAKRYIDLDRHERRRYTEEGSRPQASEHARYPANHRPVIQCRVYGATRRPRPERSWPVQTIHRVNDA